MKRLLLIPVFSMLALMMSVGCRHVNPPIQGRADPYTASQIHFDSEALSRDTAVGTPITALNESGLLTVTIPIRSAINKTLYVDARVTFFDRNGVPVERMGPITRTLDPNTPDQITVTSTSRQAADFQVDFRYAR